jgi:subtilisin family serine protease
MSCQHCSSVAGICLVFILAAATSRPAMAGPLVPNDPYYSSAWYGPTLGLPQAWGYSLGSPSVIVAVLDTGVIDTEPDFNGRVLPSPIGTPAATSNRHGTWVASTLGMQINNGIGGAGVGDFSILPITVTDSLGHNSSDDIAAGIRLAADNGARVINISLGTLSYGRLDAAAAYARSKGALTFIAAGNSDDRVVLPQYDNLIFVAGTDRTDHRWDNDGDVNVHTSGSTWGPYVDLSAPSEGILVADPPPGIGYGHIAGTSFASPLAAGAAALAWSINPKLTPDEVQNILYSTAVDLGDPGWDEMFGHGRLDIGAVAAAAAATVPEPGVATVVVAMIGFIGCRRQFCRTAKSSTNGHEEERSQ